MAFCAILYNQKLRVKIFNILISVVCSYFKYFHLRIAVLC